MAAARSKKLKTKEVLPLLTLLVDKNLVVTEQTPHGQRYRLTETVREYLLELFGHNVEAVASRKKHRHYFAEFAESSEARLTSPDVHKWTEIYEDEHDNLRLAQENARTEDPNEALRIAGSLWRFWTSQGYVEEGKNRVLQALNESGDAEESLERAHGLHALGALCWVSGELDLAEDALQQSLAMHRKFGDQYGVASNLLKLGNISLDRSQYALARSQYEESLTIYRALNMPEHVASALNNLGNIAAEQGDMELALQIYEETLAVSRKAGNPVILPYALGNMAVAHLAQCRYDEAMRLLKEAMRLAEETGDRRVAVANRLVMGTAAHSMGNTDYARQLLEETVHEADSIVDLVTASEARLRLAELLFDMGDADSAIALCREGCAGYQVLGGVASMARVFMIAGMVLSDPRLWGVGNRLRSENGVLLMANERRRLDHHVRRVRDAIGNEAFDAAWREGENMTMDEAVAIVLG